MRFLEWIKVRLGVADSAPAAKTQPPRVRVNPGRPTAKSRVEVENDQPLEFSTEVVGSRIESNGPGKNVLVRKKFVREETGTHEKLKIVDETISIDEAEDGLDPYNTGRFDRSKSWDSQRFRK